MKPKNFRGAWNVCAAASATVFGVNCGEIFGRSRRAQVALARQVAHYVFFKAANRTAFDTAEIVGRHHTTLAWSIRAVHNAMSTIPSLRADVSAVGKEAAPGLLLCGMHAPAMTI